ncbi:MAG: DUF4157 domain-containing protein [Kofleriaceae bacterium]
MREASGSDHGQAGAAPTGTSPGVPGKATRTQRLQRKADRAPAADPAAALGMVAGGSGAPLPEQPRAQFEQSLGADLSAVRVHTGAGSAQAADALGARAFATGQDIHFGAGQYNPGDPFGMHLLAHEVAHTVQQGGAGAPQAKLTVSQPGDALEHEADRAADAMVAGAPAQVSTGAAPGIHRNPLDTAREQHDARGDNPAPPGGTSPTPGFSNMGPDDHGPEIHHDHGHMEGPDGNFDPSLHQDPTLGDRWELAKWIAKLEAAELLRPDLVDGTSAYRHFLQGNGRTRDIRYARFINNDAAGAVVLQSAMSDARDAAIRRHDEDVAGHTVEPGTRSYHIRTGVIPVGGGDPRYPYPATENWQKAIGAHQIWIEATVTATIRAPEGTPAGTCPAGGYERTFHVEMTIHAEDMYNFNPGAADIATGTPDSANGRFEITGLGHEFLSTGTYARTFDFTTSMAAAPPPGTSGGGTVEPGRGPREGRAEGSRGRAAER